MKMSLAAQKLKVLSCAHMPVASCTHVHACGVHACMCMPVASCMHVVCMHACACQWRYACMCIHVYRVIMCTKYTCGNMSRDCFEVYARIILDVEAEDPGCVSHLDMPDSCVFLHIPARVASGRISRPSALCTSRHCFNITIRPPSSLMRVVSPPPC